MRTEVNDKRSNEAAIDRELCIACGACTAVCPTEALIIVGISLEFFDSRCISCGVAQYACPVGALICPVSTG
ncbi:ferredoxin [bacterium]|nr:MAG: ferredoxin [bacterium]